MHTGLVETSSISVLKNLYEMAQYFQIDDLQGKCLIALEASELNKETAVSLLEKCSEKFNMVPKCLNSVDVAWRSALSLKTASWSIWIFWSMLIRRFATFRHHVEQVDRGSYRSWLADVSEGCRSAKRVEQGLFASGEIPSSGCHCISLARCLASFGEPTITRRAPALACLLACVTCL